MADGGLGVHPRLGMNDGSRRNHEKVILPQSGSQSADSALRFCAGLW